jgi:prepilin-type N-terminal cleavage/methylation domain-containing protein
MKQEQGFTLVELLASVAIFSVITSVAVFNNSQFNSAVLLTNLTYEIALSVRQAQFYGITVKQSASSNNFDSGYGIHFDTASPTTYILFEDKPPQNHVYDVGEALETFTIQKGNRIPKLVLWSGSSTSTPSKVDISFLRPNPDTWITAGGLQSPTYNQANICVSSPLNMKRKAIIESTGQISVATDTNGVCN